MTIKIVSHINEKRDMIKQGFLIESAVVCSIFFDNAKEGNIYNCFIVVQ